MFEFACSFFIASPLHKLANMASSLHQPEASREIKNINPWYYEIVKFKRALLLSVHHFSKKMTEMDYFINTDPLTGLMNRRGMHLSIDQKIALKIPFSILLIDIDFFKRVNDTYGHAEGDLVLKNIAEMMQKNFRKDDVCCRYGGEEFIVIVPDVSQQDVYESAERFRREVEAQSIEKVGSITVSIGIASWPEASEDISEVFILADKNLYEAKNSGRNCVRL